MTLTIDCRMINSSGIGSYLRGLIPYMINSKYNIILLGNPDLIQFYFPDIDVNILKCYTPPFSVKELLFFPKKTIKIINKTNIYFSPYFNIPNGIKIPVYTTMHDIIFLDLKKITSAVGLLMRKYFFNRAHKYSSKIFTVSKFSKSRINHYLGYLKPVIVTNESVNDIFFNFKKNNNLKKEKNIVFIGNIKKHKGLNILIEAFLKAKEEGLPHTLTIIGSIEKLRTTDNDIIKKIKSFNNNSIICTGFLDDNELMNKLSKASLLVNPSLYEGFGLPPLEALVLGTQVLLSDIPTFKEIYDGFPVNFFKNNDSNDLKNKLMELLYNKEPVIPVLGEDLLNKYTFEKTAEIIFEEIETTPPPPTQEKI